MTSRDKRLDPAKDPGGEPVSVDRNDEEPEIGGEAQLFEEDQVNASMIPDAFGYRSLGENRERLNELEEFACEDLGCQAKPHKKNPIRTDERA